MILDDKEAMSHSNRVDINKTSISDWCILFFWSPATIGKAGAKVAAAAPAILLKQTWLLLQRSTKHWNEEKIFPEMG